MGGVPHYSLKGPKLRGSKFPHLAASSRGTGGDERNGRFCTSHCYIGANGDVSNGCHRNVLSSTAAAASSSSTGSNMGESATVGVWWAEMGVSMLPTAAVVPPSLIVSHWITHHTNKPTGDNRRQWQQWAVRKHLFPPPLPHSGLPIELVGVTGGGGDSGKSGIETCNQGLFPPLSMPSNGFLSHGQPRGSGGGDWASMQGSFRIVVGSLDFSCC